MQTDTRLCVYTYWGDHIAKDLCHEVCHGYLHAVVPRIPLWIDEGLAEFYESDRGKTGWNPTQFKLLIAAREETDWQPDLERLEKLKQTEELTEIDYAEAWLWGRTFYSQLRICGERCSRIILQIVDIEPEMFFRKT